MKTNDAAIPIFKTKQGETEYFKAYEKTLSLWPVPFEENDIPTRFGSTHVITCGAETSPPLDLKNRISSEYPARAGHVLTMDRPDEVNSRMIGSLRAAAGGAAPVRAYRLGPAPHGVLKRDSARAPIESHHYSYYHGERGPRCARRKRGSVPIIASSW